MPIDSSKFSSNSLTGTVRVVNGFANISLPTAFYALEGNVSFNVAVRTDSLQGAVIYTSPTVTLRDVSTFVSLTANTATVNEGDLVAFTLVTANALGNSTLYYSVFPATANVTSADFVANTGSFYLTNNTGTFTLKANSDLSLVNETGENFKVQLRTVSTTGNVVYTSSNIAIADTSNAYNIIGFTAGSITPIVSGSNVTFTFTATNIPTGTLFYYSTTGNATSFSSNTGSFALNSISNTIVITNPQVPFAASKAYNVIVRSGSASGPIVATSNTMVVMDDSILPLIGTGGTYTSANGYSINYFTTSGTLTFNKGATVEYVAISGGGGGYNGGGGAGNVYDSATNGLKTVVAGTPYTVTIGAGGAAAGGTGGTTVFDILSVGGGSGGGVGGGNGGQYGGSGGASPSYAGGGFSVNNGFSYSGGGGGGAGGAGTAATGNPSPSNAGTISGGNGGIGKSAIAIDGGSTLYGGGGGGGSLSGSRGLGGSGVGGNGEQNAYYGGSFNSAVTAIAGTTGNVNTGSGGGGTSQNYSGMAGGSGIVIVRYSTPQVTFANLTTSTIFIYEGANAVFTLNTTNVSNNTLLYYYTVGNVLSSHFVSGNTGSFRTTQNSTTITLGTNSTIPANEERFFQLRIAGDTGTSADPLITSNVFTIKDEAFAPIPQGQISYTSAGTYTFTVPNRVSNVSVVAVGGGGAGSSSATTGVSRGGGGGALSYVNNIPVVAGSSYTVVVGAAGLYSSQSPGGNSRFANSSANLCIAGGGQSGSTSGVEGVGGIVILGTGGEGGRGGLYQGGYGGGGGGGGAGGYAGAGGNGSAGGGTGGNGVGGGGGGGTAIWNAPFLSFAQPSYGGGGVGILGQGPNGAGGTNVGGDSAAGGGGSGGATATYSAAGEYGGGGIFGTSPGAVGAVRIIWGVGRLFPSTNTAPVSTIT